MTAMSKWGTSTLVALLLGIGVSGKAGAATPSESAAAQALYDQARQLMSAGQYAQACPKLEESQRLDPGTGTLLNLADCYEHVGRIASAWTKFLEAEASARASGRPERATAAHGRAAALAPRLAKMVIAVASGTLSGLQVRRDGELVGPAQWGVPIPVDSGEHAVVVSAPGRKSWQSKVSIRGDNTTVTVSVPDLEPETAPPAAGPGAPSVPPPAETTLAVDAPSSVRSGSGLRIASYAAFGVGVIGLGAGTLFALRSAGLREDADDRCPIPDQCPIALRDEVNGLDRDADSAKTVATVGFVAGGVGVAAGVALFVLSRKAEPTALPQGTTVRPWLGLNAAGVSGNF